MKRYIHKQKYSECQLVSLWNSAIYFGLDTLVPKFNSKQYNKICKKALCIYGAVIEKDFEIKRLGLKGITGKYNLNWIKNNLPVELNIYCHRGHHSILIVDYIKNKLFITNYAKNRLYNITWRKLLNKINKRVLPISWKLRRK